VSQLESGDALLAVAGGWVYVANAEDQLRRISLQKGTAEAIKGRNGAPVTAIQAAVLGDAVYFLSPDFLGRWSPASNEVVRVYEGHPRALAPDGDELYVATEDGTIAVLGKTGGPRTVLAGGGATVRDLTALHRAVYWIEGAAPNRGGGRALWTARPDGQRTQLLSIQGMDLIATDGQSIYYATEGRSRLLPGERELSGTIMRFRDGQPTQLADRQETVTDLRASSRGVFWRQRRGVRWIDQSGALRALDCTVADQGVGLVESDGYVYWADASARAVMAVRLPR
jgi:outer membrane protein assembly factor BamB